MKILDVQLTEDERDEVMRLASWAASAPVMTLRSDLPTFAESAQEALYERLQALAVGRGLPDGSFYYSMLHDGRLAVVTEYVDEFERLIAKKE